MTDDDDDTPKRVYWSKEPDDAPEFSDWKIKIVPQLEDGTECPPVVYSVHRNMLYFPSGYFRALFRSERYAEFASRQSTFVFAKPVADEFASVLSFCYVDKMSYYQPIAAKTVHVQFLADYFQVPSLAYAVVLEVNRVLQKLEVDDWNDYYQAATAWKNEMILKEMIELAVLFISAWYDEVSSILELLVEMDDYEFWISVLRRIKEKRRESNQPDSEGLALFCSSFKGLDKESFEELTDPALLPKVTGKAAVIFLKLEPRLTGSNQAQEQITSLQRRCVDGLEIDLTENPGYSAQLRQSVENDLDLHLYPHAVAGLITEILQNT